MVLDKWTKLSSGLVEISVPEDLQLDVTQLFVNGQRQPVARKPNSGYLVSSKELHVGTVYL